MNIYLCKITKSLLRQFFQGFSNDPDLFLDMKNDAVKNRGYGTQAEILALDYAFQDLKLQTVFADAIHKNIRSQHVLEKVGFRETHCNDQFVYYRCDKDSWTGCRERNSSQTQIKDSLSSDI